MFKLVYFDSMIKVPPDMFKLFHMDLTTQGLP